MKSALRPRRPAHSLRRTPLRLAVERLEDRCLLSYMVTDLGTLGGMDSYAYGINNQGQVVGESRVAGDVRVHAFLWQGGVMTDLGTFGGPDSSAYGINDAGQVVGSADVVSNVYHAFLWDSSLGLQDLGTLGGTNSSASAINNHGQIVGSSDTSGTYTGHAFLYDAGQMTNLGTLGGPTSDAAAINDAGQIVGSADTIDPSHSPDAFLLSQGQMNDLGTLPGGYFSFATGINAAGEVCGWSSVPLAYSHAFVYKRGVMIDIGTLFGGRGTPNYANAYAINDAGQVVGESSFKPFLYSAGTMTDLNELIPSDSGWYLLSAHGINNAGQIVGFGDHNAAYHAFLLTPDVGAAAERSASSARQGDFVFARPDETQAIVQTTAISFPQIFIPMQPLPVTGTQTSEQSHSPANPRPLPEARRASDVVFEKLGDLKSLCCFGNWMLEPFPG
jgi:probable HAF family extracellular repeat protein